MNLALIFGIILNKLADDADQDDEEDGKGEGEYSPLENFAVAFRLGLLFALLVFENGLLEGLVKHFILEQLTDGLEDLRIYEFINWDL